MVNDDHQANKDEDLTNSATTPALAAGMCRSPMGDSMGSDGQRVAPTMVCDDGDSLFCSAAHQ